MSLKYILEIVDNIIYYKKESWIKNNEEHKNF